MSWKSFLLGLLCGTIFSLAGVYLVGNRYKVTAGGPGSVMTVKLDTWTGKSWMARYYEQGEDKIWYWQELKER